MILTPCIRVCAVDETGVCTGCKRTLEEIKNWLHYTDAERTIICKRLEEFRSFNSSQSVKQTEWKT